MSARIDGLGRFGGRLSTVERGLAAAAIAAAVAEPVVGSLAALALLLSGILLMGLRPRAALVDLADNWALLLLPAFCLVSVVWSVAPSVTFRYGLQLAATIVIAVIAARRLPVTQLMGVIQAVLLVIVALSVTTGSYRSDSGALTGYYASKNAMAGAAALLAMVSVGLAGLRGRSFRLRLVFGASALLGLAALVLAQSMSAVLSITMGLSAYVAVLVLQAVSPQARIVTGLFLGLGATFLCILLVANFDAIAAAILSATGKSVTLTGRTDLWQVAWEHIAQRPLFGVGYQAFWLRGNPVAEHLWYVFGIESRSGFHFHNTYLSNAVEIGVIGVAIEVAVIFSAVVLNARLALMRGDRTAALVFAVAVMILAVTPLEVPIFFQFNIHTMLMLVAVVHARDRLRAQAGSARRAAVPRTAILPVGYQFSSVRR